jgi:hypothetical protein
MKYPFGLMVGVRDLIALHVCLAGNFTNPCHGSRFKELVFKFGVQRSEEIFEFANGWGNI